MSWQEKIVNYKQEQEETLRLNNLKEEKANRAMEEKRLRIIKERNLPLIEQLNKLPVKEFLTEIRDDEWKLGGIVAVPGEPKIRLIAKWPRVIPDHTDAIYDSAGDWIRDESVAGWVESEGEVIEIGTRWEDIVNPKKQVFYSEYDLPSEFYWYHDSGKWWYPSDEGRKRFIENITGEDIYSFPSYPKASEGDKQPFSLQRNRDRREEGSNLPEKEKMVLYGHAVGWNPGSSKTTYYEFYSHARYFNYYSGFEGPSINDPDIVSKLEKSLIKMCLLRREGGKDFLPPFDRCKEESKLEAIKLVNAGQCRRGFGNISSEEIKKTFT